MSNSNDQYLEALRRQQEYARRSAARAAAQGGQVQQAGGQAAGQAQQAAQAGSSVQAGQPAQAQAQGGQVAARHAAAQSTRRASQPTYSNASNGGFVVPSNIGAAANAGVGGPSNFNNFNGLNNIDSFDDDFIASGDFTPVHSGAGAQKGGGRKKKKGLRIFLVVLAVLLVLGLAALAYATWYMNSIASNMAMDTQDQQALEQVLAPVDNTAEPYYVLLIGNDNWENHGERSDALMLIRVDEAGHKVTMVSIPRDTPYQLNGQTVKLNQAFAEQGPTGAVEAVQGVTGVNISYYAEIDFAGLATFVDSIGGITVNVPYTIDYQVYTKDQDPVHIEAGEQVLTGEQAVALK